jgi:2-oxoglutarate/2-oxoacid ferredoxin oxidoreductase subunit alpha
MNMGQMVDDVRMALGPDRKIDFFGRAGGVVPTPEEILGEIRRLTR